MVCLAEWCDKLTETQFRTPPWTSESAEWKTLDEQLAAEHPGRRLVAAVDYLDLSELIASYSLGGSDALSPRMMLRMIVLEMWEGGTHPSQWCKDAATSDVLKWAGFGLRPSRSSWYNFRDRVGPFLQDLLGQDDFVGRRRQTQAADMPSFQAEHPQILNRRTWQSLVEQEFHDASCSSRILSSKLAAA